MIDRLDRFQQRHRAPAFVIAVVRKFIDDRGARLASVIAYYGVFSIFPAMLALMTVLGYVLEGHKALRDRISESALAQFPVIGESIGRATSEPLSGSAVALSIGLVAATWAGLGAMQAAQYAMNEVWDVPRAERPRFVAARVRSLSMMLTIAVGLVATSMLSHLAVDVVDSTVVVVALFAATILVDTGLYAIGFRLLTARRLAWRAVLPGAAVGGCLYAILHLLGTAYVTRVLNGATKTYGTFAAVIGLLSWIHLLAQITMVAAEVNVVAMARWQARTG